MEDSCVRGCYRCLLSYGNQRDHEIIDRRLVIDRLMQLAGAVTVGRSTDAESPGTPCLPELWSARGPKASWTICCRTGEICPIEIGPSIEGNVVDFVYTAKLSVGIAVDCGGRVTDLPSMTWH